MFREHRFRCLKNFSFRFLEKLKLPRFPTNKIRVMIFKKKITLYRSPIIFSKCMLDALLFQGRYISKIPVYKKYLFISNLWYIRT